MNESLIAAAVARLAKDGDNFSSTEYIVRCEHGTMMRIGPDRDGLDMIRCLFTEPTTHAGRTLADFDMTTNFARRVALALLQAADDMYFTPFVGDQFGVKPSPSREGRVEVVSEMCEDSVSLVLERTQAVAAALHMIACALGEAAALDAERAVAPHMKVSKP